MKKRLLATAMALCLMFPATAWAQEDTENTEAADNTEKKVVIYHTNDTHGYLGGGDEIIGIDTVAGLKDSMPGSILVDAGDATQGLPLASLTKGADVISLMNLAGYDLMAAGNHEFDFGTDQLLSNARLANFPVLAANVKRGESPLLAGYPEGNNGCHTVIERNGIRIGFFGITTKDTATSTNPAGIADLTFADEIETAKEEIDELEAENVDAIVAVCHLGDSETASECTSEALAEAMTGTYQGKIDAIIDGHSHTVENKAVNGILIAQTGTGMAGVGELTLAFQGDEVSASETLLKSKDVSAIAPNAEVTAKLSQIRESQDEMLSEVLGTAETTLWGGNIGVVSIARVVETNYGDLAADAFRSAAQTFVQDTGGEEADFPVIAVENAGGIRAGAANGNITVGDLATAFPNANTIYLKVVTPRILYAVMENSASYLDGQNKETGMLLQGSNSGGFLQIAGFTVVYDPDGEKGRRVRSITLDGQPTPLDQNDDSTPIMLASNSYIMNGGSDYTMLGELSKYGEIGGELETIQAYLESCLENGVLHGYAGTKNRIQMRSDGYEPKDYTAKIQIVDESRQPLAGKELSYRVDGGERKNGTTDEDGMLNITVSDGSHGVRLADNQQEVYVDNYCGLGLITDEFREWPTLTFFTDGSCDPVGNPSGGEDPGQSDPGQGDPGKEPGGQPAGDPSREDLGTTAQNVATNVKADKAAKTSDEFPVIPVALLVCSAAVAVAAASIIWKRKHK